MGNNTALGYGLIIGAVAIGVVWLITSAKLILLLSLAGMVVAGVALLR